MLEVSRPQPEETGFLSDPKRRKMLIILAPVVLILLFFGSSLIIAESDSQEIPTTRVKRGEVTIKITESGELRAQDQMTISAITDKQILWLAPEGLWVEEGDTLIKFESEKYVISKGEAESSVQVAKAEMIQAQSDYESMTAKAEAARKSYETLPELAKKGYIQESEVEQQRLAYTEMESKKRALNAAIDAARANVERAERALAQQDRKLRQGVVLAPRAGLVVYAMTGDIENQKKITVGMTPFEGMDLMYLPDVSTMLVDIELSEVDLSKVHKGQAAELRLDAYPDTLFSGEISFIADLAKRKISRITGKPTGAKVFDVTVKVNAADTRLKPGLTTTTDIIVNHYPDAVYIPLEAVFLTEQDETIVYVQKGGKIVSRPIVIQESNDRVAVIKEGLQEGEELLLARPETI